MDCCAQTIRKGTTKTSCPNCGQNGRRMPLSTIKTLLKPVALATLEPYCNYTFCPNPPCETVYFACNGSLDLCRGRLESARVSKGFEMDVTVC
jgi:hypothetical protein